GRERRTQEHDAQLGEQDAAHQRLGRQELQQGYRVLDPTQGAQRSARDRSPHAVGHKYGRDQRQEEQRADRVGDRARTPDERRRPQRDRVPPARAQPRRSRVEDEIDRRGEQDRTADQESPLLGVQRLRTG